MEYEQEILVEEMMKNKEQVDVLKPRKKPLSGLGAEIKSEVEIERE